MRPCYSEDEGKLLVTPRFIKLEPKMCYYSFDKVSAARPAQCEQEAQLLLGDRATRKHAKDS